MAVVAGQPRLWLLGAAGFLLRGGIVVLIAPVLVVPTQVEIRLLLGDYLGTSGITPSFYPLVIGIAVVAAVVLLGLVLVLARLELGLFDALSTDERVAAHVGDWQPIARGEASRGTLFARLVTVQVWTVIAILIAALPLALAIGETAYAEVIRPTSPAPIYQRVLGAVTVPFMLFVGAFLAIEALSAVISRRLLVGRRSSLGLIGAATSGLRRVIRSPLRTLAAALSGWALALVALTPVLAIIVVTWQPVRRAFLSSVSFGDVVEPRTLMAAIVLAGSFVIGLVVAGFVSAVRSAIWTVDSVS
ncbi:MAG TPA: hypothetical protein VMZ33_00125 [Candidatus Limnocylindrales bacterium]|nr:hypothetical protein [Candidatus Limnocylindrales bacterium]